MISLGTGLTIISCTNDREIKVEDISNNEEDLSQIERQFIEVARTGTYKQLKELYFFDHNKISFEAIKQAVDIALENRNVNFFFFFEEEIFSKSCDDFKEDISDTSLFDFLLSERRDFKIMDVCGYSPEHWAASKGDVEVFSYFERYRQNEKFVNKYGETPVSFALNTGALEYPEVGKNVNEYTVFP